MSGYMMADNANSKESFNKEFCDHLEYHLCRTFANSPDPVLKAFWCDGVSEIPSADYQITKKSVNDTRRIATTAWLGKSGQEEYEMTIRFGRYSLRRYAKGANMIDCIPSEDTMDWINIDTDDKAIEICLN
jgi:hypothetical protein